ncbi:MAG: DNA polymerase III subunit delta [Bacteroidales bacterium]|nr:DNA polymerase III subunit delta [Bacteroidales bacterium]
MQFKDIPGLEEIKHRLRQTVLENRISHAQLFYGEEGSAALALAMAYAQYITCLDRQEEDSCGVCASCIKAQELIHPDIIFSYPVVKSGAMVRDSRSSLQIEKWREIILENPYIGPAQWYEQLGVENKQGMIYTEESDEIIRKISLKSFESEYKVLVLWLPEKMNVHAANKLLKSIEEPPDKTVFLLVSIEPEKILPTIMSRCQALKIPKIDHDSLGRFLQERYRLTEDELERAVSWAGGNVRDALRLIEEEKEGNEFMELFIRWMRLAWVPDVPGLTTWSDEMASLGREKQKAFLKYTIHILRENLLLHILPNDKKIHRMTKQEFEFSKKFSAFISPGNMENLYALLNEAFDHISGNVYGKLVFMDVSLKIHKLLKK